MEKTNPKEFKINEYITLKLIGAQTEIYLDGIEFRQCKRLFINISIDDIDNYKNANSIDEITAYHNEQRDTILVPEITPEIEFWGHCSNLQAWAENNYDTRILHSNLAFPLLKKLTEIGDPIAKRVFKEEIVKRYSSGYPPVVEYLKARKYLNY